MSVPEPHLKRGHYSRRNEGQDGGGNNLGDDLNLAWKWAEKIRPVIRPAELAPALWTCIPINTIELCIAFPAIHPVPQ
jgi:hypothetical protein